MMTAALGQRRGRQLGDGDSERFTSILFAGRFLARKWSSWATQGGEGRHGTARHNGDLQLGFGFAARVRELHREKEEGMRGERRAQVLLILSRGRQQRGSQRISDGRCRRRHRAAWRRKK